MNCRAGIAVILLALLALEILPCTYRQGPVLASGAASDLTCRIEPLQVCDHGDPYLGALADLPVLVPGGPAVPASSEVLVFVPEGTAFFADGFAPPIDHPPQLSA